MSYPRIGQKIFQQHPKGLCKICGKPKSDCRIDIEVDWFRGNDEVFKVHKKCIKGKKSPEILRLLGFNND